MIMSVTYIVKGGTQGAFGSDTVLQAGRSTVWFLIVSWKFTLT